MLGLNSFSLLLTEMERGKGYFMIHLHLKASQKHARSQTYKYNRILESLIIFQPNSSLQMFPNLLSLSLAGIHYSLLGALMQLCLLVKAECVLKALHVLSNLMLRTT